MVAVAEFLQFGDRRKILDVSDVLNCFDYLELFAIQRPGWVQVLKFSLRVPDSEGEWSRWLGVVRDDERNSIQVSLVESELEQEQIAERVSKDLHKARRQPLSKIQIALVTLGASLVGFAALGALLSLPRV